MPDPRFAALDRPIWSALTSGWSRFAEGDARALRLDRACGVFGAAADRSDESLRALADLVPADGELWLVERDPPSPPGTRTLGARGLVQMAAEAVTPGGAPAFAIVELGDDDAPAMYDLATLTRPGPYVEHTHRLGRFIGVKHEGRLVAMAGERMRMRGLAEVSGVCIHPDWRGRGYAAALMRRVATRILVRGEMPFLHAYADNAGAIALYRSLGFALVGEVTATIVVRA